MCVSVVSIVSFMRSTSMVVYSSRPLIHMYSNDEYYCRVSMVPHMVVHVCYNTTVALCHKCP